MRQQVENSDAVTEEALRESEEKFRSSFDYAPIGMALVNLEGKFLQVNNALCSLLGYPEIDLLNLTFQKITHPDDLDLDLSYQGQLLKEEINFYQMEKRYITKSSGIIWVLLSVSMVHDAKGKPLYFIKQVQDITHQKKIADSLRESEERFRNSFDYAAIGMALVSPDGYFMKINQSFCKLTGYSEEELKNKTFREITHPDDIDADMKNARKLLAGKIKNYQIEKRYITKSGGYIRVRLSVSMVHDAQGGPLYTIKQVQDITTETKIEESLRESEQKFRNSFDYAPIGMAMVSTNGSWLQVNKALCDILGYTEKELSQKTFQEITHPEDLEADLENHRRLIKGESNFFQMEKKYFHKNGSIIWILLSVTLVRDPKGIPLYFIKQVLDISVRKKNGIRTCYPEHQTGGIQPGA